MFTELPATGVAALALPDNLETTEHSLPQVSEGCLLRNQCHQPAHPGSSAGSISPEALAGSFHVGVTESRVSGASCARGTGQEGIRVQASPQIL